MSQYQLKPNFDTRMEIENINESVSVSGQISVDDVNILAEQGVVVLVCNRPDGESGDQPLYSDIAAAAARRGMAVFHLPFSPAGASAEQVKQMADLIGQGKKLHAFCRTGNRSKAIYQHAMKIEPHGNLSVNNKKYDVVIVGAGSGGIATASSLYKRNKSLRIALIDPADDHYYQPGWTMVGGGVFDAKSTHKKMKEVIPVYTDWIKASVEKFLPNDNAIVTSDESKIYYSHLVVAPGLKLNWDGIEGLEETLGKNGVTSNYRYDLAPYTWELVENFSSGKAIFTQPPMPIKCAGAPQKALYLSASKWLSADRLNNIDIEFYNAGAVLFGVADYVPALETYIEKYGAQVNYNHQLIKVDGDTKTAWFKHKTENQEEQVVETKFDFLHVSPPQCAPDFIRDSELSDEAGWLNVDPATLQQKDFKNIWGVGDVLNTTNAKTMAAARKQAPVVAENIVCALGAANKTVGYDGYGSCPLTVEHGKIVLAEFTYGGKVAPTFPGFVNEGTKPTRLAWTLKAKMLPFIYWNAMLKGREWFARPS